MFWNCQWDIQVEMSRKQGWCCEEAGTAAFHQELSAGGDREPESGEDHPGHEWSDKGVVMVEKFRCTGSDLGAEQGQCTKQARLGGVLCPSIGLGAQVSLLSCHCSREGIGAGTCSEVLAAVALCLPLCLQEDRKQDHQLRVSSGRSDTSLKRAGPGPPGRAYQV